eukprot:6731372-Pyramimonas_sp.AAC.1
MSSTNAPSIIYVLRSEALDADARAMWFRGVAGLRLNIDLLRELGATPEFLHWWEHGRPLAFLDTIRPRVFQNSKSLLDNVELAEYEWNRLERL